MRRRDPHIPLALAAALLLGGEAERLDRMLLGPIVEAAVASAALLVAWRHREALRLPAVLGLAMAFQLAWVGIHLVLGVRGGVDPDVVYAPEGRALLHGTYPHSPYPAGAAALFALETWLGGGSARATNALSMVPFQALTVVALWLLRTQWTAWVAAAVAIWPVNAFFWEFRFDLVPAAALVGGIALARREQWYTAGWVLGLGALVKWTPALCVLALGGWLLVARRPRAAASHLLGFALPVMLVSVPLLILTPGAAAAPYGAQSARGITGESLLYLPLRLAGLARPARHYYGPAIVPGWSMTAAIALQLVAVAAVIGLAASAHGEDGALAIAALAPAAFLLTNRIFSPQFFVVVATACACAAALTARRPLELLMPSALVGVATTANAVLFPGLAGQLVHGWTFVSAAALLPATAAVALLAARGRA